VQVEQQGEADVEVSQADPQVEIEEADQAQVDVQQGDPQVVVEEGGQQAASAEGDMMETRPGYESVDVTCSRPRT
jgi:hypothetical protein